MKRSVFSASATVAAVSLLTGCSSQAVPSAANAGASPAAGTSPAMAGSSGLGSAGAQRSAGIGGGAAAGASNAGVGGTGPTVAGAGGASAVPATFETFKFVITQTPCFGAGCHNDAQNPLNLRADDLLYKRVSSHISKNCGNLPIVNPGKPQESALIKILKGPCAPTPRMPVGCVDDEDAKCIPSDYIAAIAQWIANGAKEQ